VNSTNTASTPAKTAGSKAHAWYVVALLMVAFTFSHMDRNVMSILLNSIKGDLGLTDLEAGLMHGPAFALFYVAFGLPIARAADRFNRVNIISVAIALWSGMTALCGAAGNFIQLALARMGVGIGEAGCVPPAQSIIADYIPPHNRAFAMSIFSLGAPLGVLLGNVLGGYLDDVLSWRHAFWIIGIPGILVALVIKLTIKEPKRGSMDSIPMTAGNTPPVGEVLKTIWKLKSLKHMMIGSSLIVFGGYGATAWMPAFLERSHGLETFQVGLMLGPAMLLGGVGGLLLSGRLTDNLVQKSVTWYARVPALATLCAVPFTVFIMLIPQATVTLFGISFATYWLVISLIIIPGAAYISYMGPANALMQNMMPPRMRAMTVAIFLFVTNLVGMGLGPPLIGQVSDIMQGQYGNEGLRYSLLSFSFVYVWAAFHFFRARRYLVRDLGTEQIIKR
jgi:MFS family permease